MDSFLNYLCIHRLWLVDLVVQVDRLHVLQIKTQTTNQTPAPTSNTDVNVDSCGTPHAMEDEGDTLVLGKQRRFISKIWKYYDYEVISGVPKAICKYCKKKLGGNSRNGTKHLNDHYAICPMKRHRDIANDFTQNKLKIEPFGDKKGQVLFVNEFDEGLARKGLILFLWQSMLRLEDIQRLSNLLSP